VEEEEEEEDEPKYVMCKRLMALPLMPPPSSTGVPSALRPMSSSTLTLATSEHRAPMTGWSRRADLSQATSTPETLLRLLGVVQGGDALDEAHPMDGQYQSAA
jgi:hypothetical protein